MKILKFLAAAFLCANSLSAQEYVGGDISLLPKYEQNGAKYFDHDGRPLTDVIVFFKQQGLNSMRVRLFVNPENASATDKRQGVCQNLEFVKKLAKRIKTAGMSLILDFHYSDSWADPAKQWTPKDWEQLNDEGLYTEIYKYTVDVLQELVKIGATPDFIQTGNEISYGMLWGKEGSQDHRCYIGNTANWARFTTLLKRAGQACREICPQAKIILHTERTLQPNVQENFYQKMAEAGVDYDVIGLSYYPAYHGTLSSLDKALTALENKFGDKKIMIVETGYPYAWPVGGTTYDLTSTYPYSDAGQEHFTKDLISTLHKHQNVNGLYWWFPEANENGLDWTSHSVTDSWYNAPLFDNRTGRATSALSALKTFLSPTSGIVSLSTSTADSSWYTLQGLRISQPQTPGLYLKQNQKILIR